MLLALAFAGAVGTSTASIDVHGVRRTYRIHVPARQSTAMPLVFAFHGYGGDGLRQEEVSGFDALADRDGFIVVYPDGINRSWNDGRNPHQSTADDVGFVESLIDRLSATYSIDAHRIYATGMSNGAMFTQYLGCRLADRLAAIAPVSGPMPVDDVGGCSPARPISVLEIHGTADPIISIRGGAIRTFRGRGNGGSVESFADTLAFWARGDRCEGAPERTHLAPISPDDGTSVSKFQFEGCVPGRSVVGYAIAGGGHSWPNSPSTLRHLFPTTISRQLNASETIVAFFLAHPMP